MQVRVFESEDMASALKKVKETLGPDALILSTRTVRKGGLGVLGKPTLEVTAAVESPGQIGAGQKNSAGRKDISPGEASALRARLDVRDELSYDDLWAEPAAPRSSLRPHPDGATRIRSVAEASAEPAGVDLSSLRSEIDELKNMVKGFIDESQKQPRFGSAAAAIGAGEPSADMPSARFAASPGKPAEESPPMVERLHERGIDRDAARTIASFATQKLSSAQQQTPEVMDAYFEDVISDLVRTGVNPQRPRSRQRRLALIGPTGVGKTTTIAKLAAEHILNGGQSVALVTIDTFRIAAVEQLKVYGEIMNLPVEVVMSAKQLQEVLATHKDKELILIDTAGRSPRDAVSLEELSEILHPKFKTENHLVLSAATRDQDLYEAVARFGRVPIHNLIFTKLDECSSLGVILNVHLRHNFPVSFLTNGQRVPEDILPAEAEQIAALIMGKK